MSDNAIMRAMRRLDDYQLAAVRQMYSCGTASKNAGSHCDRLAEFQLAIAVTAAIEQQCRLELMRRAEEATRAGAAPLRARWNLG